MNGLLSRSPSPAVVRPLLGVALLAPVGAILLLSLPTMPGLARLAAGVIALLSIAAIMFGIAGERTTARPIADREASR